MKQSSFVFPLVISISLFACGGSEDDPPSSSGDPSAAMNGYSAPADRIDPEGSRALSAQDFVQLGAARVGARASLGAPLGSELRYVSAASGDDANDGSEGQPWKTIQHAADQAEPGMSILVDASGDYPLGIEILRGGTEDEVVEFRPQDPAQLPRITGANGRNAYVEIVASHVVFQGFEIDGGQSANLDFDAFGILVEPRTDDLENIEVRNNVVHDIGPGPVEETSCSYDGHGIIAQAEGQLISDLVIEGNELYNLFVGNSECLVVNGNIETFRVAKNFIHDVNNIAIDVIGYEKNDHETARGGYVADNVVLDASNYWPYCSRGNCTYPEGDESSDGIYVDGGADIIIEYNVVGRADHGIELQSENGELIRNVEVRFNVVFNSNYRQITVGENDNSTEHDNVLIDDPGLANSQLEGCR